MVAAHRALAGAEGVEAGQADPALGIDGADQRGVAQKAAYFHRSWVHLPQTTGLDEMRHRVTASYDVVRSKLTKKVQAALASREG